MVIAARLVVLALIVAQAGALRVKKPHLNSVQIEEEIEQQTEEDLPIKRLPGPRPPTPEMIVKQVESRKTWPIKQQSSHIHELTKTQSAADWARAIIKTDRNKRTQSYDCVVPPVGQEKNHYCSMDVCIQGKSEVPRLFVDLHYDGEGHRMENLLQGILVAKKYGLQFGGVLANDIEDYSEHGYSTVELLQHFFGEEDNGHIMWYGTPPCFDTILSANDLKLHQANKSQIFFDGFSKDTNNIYVPETNFLSRDNFWDDDMMAALRKPLLPKVSFFDNDPPVQRLSVAIHVRRDDRPRNEITPDQYFFDLIDNIRELHPNADIHAWSSIGGTWGVFSYVNASDFEAWKKRDVQLHLDTDIVEAWAHMATAKILVGDRSHFTEVPALMNPNCFVQMVGSGTSFHNQPGKDSMVFRNKAKASYNKAALPVDPSSLKNNLQLCVGQ